ncbi:hypothetical protein DMA11_20655 [Marinilabiliaceae bacterium JC017]|nr:hypothetical protein DMA11_20655 [Marinilabiliaceae bacterium JC017]
MEIADRLVNRLFPVNKVWGIHIWESLNGEYRIFTTLIENKKGTLFIKENFEFENINQLFREDFKDIPICLSYDGPRVLLKKIPDYHPQSLAESLHINSLDEFEVQITSLLQGCQACVIRREQIHDLLTLLREENLNLVSITLGAMSFQACLSFIENKKDNTIHEFCNYRIQVEEEAIVKIERVKQWADKNGLQLGNEFIEGHYLLPYCNVLSVFLYETEVPYLLLRPFKPTVREYAYDKLYKKLFPICLGLLFSVLLGNFFLLQHYKDDQQQLSVEYAGYQMAHKKLNQLQKKFDDHKSIIGQLDAESYGYFSFYADRIASLVKGRLRLTTLTIHPCSEENNKMEKVFVFKQNIIEVTGTCRSPLVLSQWIADLGKESFVHNISNQVYTYDEIGKTGRFSFQLEVKPL